MGLIADILSFVSTVAAGAFAIVLAGEAQAWRPKIVDFLRRRALKKVPEEVLRTRLDEEWRAAIAEIPGDIGKLAFAFDLTRGARRIARDSRKSGSELSERSLDIIALYGSKFIGHQLFKQVKRDLAQNLAPDRAEIVLKELKVRFAPRLQRMVREKLPRIGNPGQAAAETQQLFVSVVDELAREIQERQWIAGQSPAQPTSNRPNSGA